jgi:hypothetical protein
VTSPRPGTYEELEAYAARVAGGFRPPLHDRWPPEISSLIKVCVCVGGGSEVGGGVNGGPEAWQGGQKHAFIFGCSRPALLGGLPTLGFRGHSLKCRAH